VFRAPLVLWRLGGAPLLRRSFLVLATTGRRSGTTRYAMLEYTMLDGRAYISSGWAGTPDWWRNATVNPRVTVQMHDGTHVADARRVTDGDEIGRLFVAARGKSPIWDEYLQSLGIGDDVEDAVKKKDRFHILRLDPCGGPGPAALRPDLIWIWPLIGVALLFGWCFSSG
jgi:deazaflavin-dependent oxidoreductase (nitroreductase family)